MKKSLFLFILFMTSSSFADSCFPLYEKKAEQIQEKDGYTTHVGGQIYVANGQIGYWPGMKVNATIDNWARDLVDAIKWGPFIWTNREDPRKEWLEAFRKSIKEDCDLPKENYDTLRAMLKELMEDGSFCAGGKILEPKLLGGKSSFKKVIQEAVKSQRFAHYCQGLSVANGNTRDIKDVGEKKSPKNETSSSSQQ